MTILIKSDQEGKTLFSLAPLYTRIQTLRELLDDYDHDELVHLKTELQEQIRRWRDEYEVSSPDELRERAA